MSNFIKVTNRQNQKISVGNLNSESTLKVIAELQATVSDLKKTIDGMSAYISELQQGVVLLVQPESSDSSE